MTGLFHLRFNACISPGPGSAAGQETDERENARNVSRVKAPTAKRSEKGDGDERDPGIIIWLERQETHLAGQNAQC